MSADLFAEFNNLSRPPAQQQSQAPSTTNQPQTPQSQDPFAFLQSNSNPQSTSSPQASSPWSTFQSQPSGNTQPPPGYQESNKWPTFQSHPGAISQITPNYQTSQPWPSIQTQSNGSAQSAQNYQAPQPWPAFQPQTSSQVLWGAPAQNTQQPPSKPQESTDDDDWGDFEVAEPAPKQPTAAATARKSQGPAKPTHSQAPPTRIVRASTMDLISNNLIDIGSSAAASTPPPPSIQEVPRSPAKRKAVPKGYAQDPSILFDANDFELESGEFEGDEGDDDDDDDDDEFGEFETVPSTELRETPQTTEWPTAQPKTPNVYNPPPSMDLLSLDEPPATEPNINLTPSNNSAKPLSFGATTAGPSSHRRQESVSKRPLRASTVSAKSSQPVQRAMEQSNADSDDWGAWDEFAGADAKTEPTEPTVACTSPAQTPDSWDWDVVDTAKSVELKVATSSSMEDVPPPVNVPPPSVLLSTFTELLGAGSSLFKPMTGQNSSIKQRIMSDPKAVDFICGYILLGSTAAHIIAGRKQRWHRDKILAKSMSISAAGSKGMKLAGVDKAQSAREDRDAADVVAVWKENVGRLRSAVAAANSSGKASLKVPDISESMPIQTIKQALTAPKPCVICGLKREERVAKVDHDVEDSFGEWWVDHWGHRACKNFWIEHEQTLRQR